MAHQDVCLRSHTNRDYRCSGTLGLSNILNAQLSRRKTWRQYSTKLFAQSVSNSDDLGLRTTLAHVIILVYPPAKDKRPSKKTNCIIAWDVVRPRSLFWCTFEEVLWIHTRIIFLLRFFPFSCHNMTSFLWQNGFSSWPKCLSFDWDSLSHETHYILMINSPDLVHFAFFNELGNRIRYHALTAAGEALNNRPCFLAMMNPSRLEVL